MTLVYRMSNSGRSTAASSRPLVDKNRPIKVYYRPSHIKQNGPRSLVSAGAHQVQPGGSPVVHCGRYSSSAGSTSPALPCTASEAELVSEVAWMFTSMM